MHVPFSSNFAADMVSVTIHERATTWLEGDTRPARSGVYQRQYPAGPYSFWDGQTWHADAASPEEAATLAEPSMRQSCLWRGLVQKLGASEFLGEEGLQGPGHGQGGV